MAQPPAYTRKHDFNADEPDDTDGQSINGELDSAAVSINAIRKNLALIQRDDGGLANGIVTEDSLSPTLKKDLFNTFSGDINDSVLAAQQAAADAENSALTAQQAAATASSAATAASTASTTAVAAAQAAGASQNAAAGSATAAAASATTAGTAATSATGSATSATNSAAAALADKTSADASATTATGAATTATTAATSATASKTAAATSETNAGASATAAAASEALAEAWATKLVTPVAGGEFSAKYYAELAGSLAGYPPLHRSGGTITYTTTTTMTIAPGAWRSFDNLANIMLPAALTKTLQASGTWAAGNNANGLFAGAIAASTWYHLFVIHNDTTGAVDAGFDTDLTASHRPAGWSSYRRVCSVLTNVNALIASHINVGNRFIRRSPVTGISGVSIPVAGVVTAFGSLPPGVPCVALLSLTLHTASGGAISVSTPGTAPLAAVIPSIQAQTPVWAVSNTTSVLTDAAASMQFTASNASCTLDCTVVGYEDFQQD